MSYLHKDKIRICLRGFGWTQFTSRDYLSNKTRWEYLSSRRKYRKLTTLYKMLISQCRQILGNCLPLTVYNINDHNLRSDENYATPWVVDIGHHIESFTVATTTGLTGMKYMCHKWPRIYFNGLKHFPVLLSFVTFLRILIKKNSLVKIYKNEWVNTVVLGYTPVGSSFIYIMSLSS